MEVLQSDKAPDVQKLACMNNEQWARFAKIAHEEGQKLCNCYRKSVSWPDVPYNESEKIFTNINARLESEGIPMITRSILRWRMRTTLRKIRPNNSVTVATLPYNPTRPC
ncbi:hypothetical protein BU24DRAFT_419870 [Aaosphaeria arxii CBS 175.79]|uniref:Uncharacterized protein n=1 Tax=Aaosphaeria arxii CBS 175.79 TaxID=1450172 RepID=A0A6A5Y6A6_9PLEO|nr:uncharacterized protein BU24DRAFT_419870 [Aaosphaeria arxii CBS 175.79]KAF2020330.1 hypothetical protein BU24DRAFT_419870 [Aaosphaeria arxii CBS 175.79]